MRFSRTNMRLAAARLPDLSREIDAQAAEFSITHFCPRNPGLTKSTTYARETAKIGRSLFKSSFELSRQAGQLVSRRRNRADLLAERNQVPLEPLEIGHDRKCPGHAAPVPARFGHQALESSAA